MKLYHLVLCTLLITCTFSSCKEEAKQAEKQETSVELAEVKLETISLHISGMSCEISCAKTIQSKLSKKEGVAEAKVVFKDSLATVAFDTNKSSSEDLIAFINGIAGGDMYTANIAEEKSTKE